MKVQRIQQHQNKHQNFTAIRIVNKTSTDDMRMLKEFFSDFFEKNSIIRAESPAHDVFYKNLFEKSERENLPKNWLIRNAEIHNIMKPKEMEELPLFVFTEKDNANVGWHGVKNSFAYIKFGFQKAADYRADCENGLFPEHLLDLKMLRDFADSRLPVFKKFLVKNNAKNVTMQELFNEITEKKI